MRDGVNVAQLEKVRPLIKPSDLAGLADLEAYVKLPDQDVRCCKLKMKYRAAKNKTRAFISKAEYCERIEREKTIRGFLANLSEGKLVLQSNEENPTVKEFAEHFKVAYSFEKTEEETVILFSEDDAILYFDDDISYKKLLDAIYEKSQKKVTQYELF